MKTINNIRITEMNRWKISLLIKNAHLWQFILPAIYYCHSEKTSIQEEIHTEENLIREGDVDVNHGTEGEISFLANRALIKKIMIIYLTLVFLAFVSFIFNSLTAKDCNIYWHDKTHKHEDHYSHKYLYIMIFIVNIIKIILSIPLFLSINLYSEKIFIDLQKKEKFCINVLTICFSIEAFITLGFFCQIGIVILDRTCIQYSQRTAALIFYCFYISRKILSIGDIVIKIYNITPQVVLNIKNDGKNDGYYYKSIILIEGSDKKCRIEREKLQKLPDTFKLMANKKSIQVYGKGIYDMEFDNNIIYNTPEELKQMRQEYEITHHINDYLLELLIIIISIPCLLVLISGIFRRSTSDANSFAGNCQDF